MNNRDYSKGKSNSNFIIKNVKSILIILSMFILLSISVIAATNVSILYGWNGTANVPIGVDAQGRLKTTMNLTKSTGLFPDIDSTRNLGTPSLKWGTLYVVDIVAAGSINVGGSLNATSINTTGDAYFGISGSGKVGIGTQFPNSTLHVTGTVNVTGNLTAYGKRTGVDFQRFTDDTAEETWTKPAGAVEVIIEVISAGGGGGGNTAYGAGGGGGGGGITDQNQNSGAGEAGGRGEVRIWSR
jgi:hypothetical protein